MGSVVARNRQGSGVQSSLLVSPADTEHLPLGFKGCLKCVLQVRGVCIVVYVGEEVEVCV